MALLPKQEHLRLYAPLDGKFEDKLSETRRAWGYPASPADSSGGGYTLTEGGNVFSRKSPEAKFGWGYDFDGTGDYLTTTNTALRILGDLSITVNFEIDSLPASNALIVMWGDNTGGTTGDVYVLRLTPAGLVQYVHYDGTSQYLSGGAAVSTGTHSLTLRRDDTGKTIDVYLDGASYISDTYTGSVTPTGDDALQVGGLSGTAGNCINGGIYEVRIWNQLIDQAILDRIVDPDDSSYTGKPEGNELALWYMGTQPAAVTGSLVGANTPADKSGNGYTFTVAGSAPFRSSPDPKWGGGYDFNGTTQYVAGSIPETLGDLSLFATFEMDNVVSKPILTYYGVDGSETEANNIVYQLKTNASSQLVYLHENGAGVDNALTSTLPLPLGLHTLTLLRDTAAKTVVVKVDGVEYINGAYANNPTGATDPNERLRFGILEDGATFMDGALYELRVWHELVVQSLLDDIANGDYMGRALGNEEGYWELADVATHRLGAWGNRAGSTNYVSQWRLDSNFNDATGTYNGTGAGGVTAGGAADPWGAFEATDFDGTDDTVTTADAVATVTNFTIQAWVNADTIRTQGIIAQSSAANTTDTFRLFMEVTGAVEFDFNTHEEINITTPVLSTGTWYLITATFDDATKTGKIYLNDTLENSATSTHSVAGGPFVFEISPLASNRWDGKMADVRFYSRVVSAEEIAAQYAARNEHQVSLSNGDGMSFNGTSQYIDVSALASLDASDTYSFAGWARLKPSSATSHIFSISAAATAGPYIRLLHGAALGWGVETAGMSGANMTAYSGGNVYRDGLWHHIALTRTAGDLKVYVDGVDLGLTSTISGNFTGDTAQIGGLAYNGGQIQWMDGDLAGIAVYDTALTAGEIKALMAATSQG